MNFSPEEKTSSPESLPENEVHRAVSEKIQRAISGALNQKIEHFVEQRVKKEDIELAAEQLFSMATQGSTEEDIERELKRTSAKIATEVISRDNKK
jgi:hypothetical protein